MHLDGSALRNSYKQNVQNKASQSEGHPDGRLMSITAFVGILAKLGAPAGRECLKGIEDRAKVNRLLTHLLQSVLAEGYIVSIGDESAPAVLTNGCLSMHDLLTPVRGSNADSVLLHASRSHTDLQAVPVLSAIHALEQVHGARDFTEKVIKQVGLACDLWLVNKADSEGKSATKQSKNAMEKELYRYLAGHKRYFGEQKSLSMCMDATRMGQKPVFSAVMVCADNTGMICPPQ
eukprot:6459175-Amphidinium_carterae.1